MALNLLFPPHPQQACLITHCLPHSWHLSWYIPGLLIAERLCNLSLIFCFHWQECPSLWPTLAYQTPTHAPGLSRDSTSSLAPSLSPSAKPLSNVAIHIPGHACSVIIHLPWFPWKVNPLEGGIVICIAGHPVPGTALVEIQACGFEWRGKWMNEWICFQAACTCVFVTGLPWWLSW